MPGFRRDQRGISPIVGAVLVIAIVSIALSVYVREVTPVYTKKNESDHMHLVRSAFLDLQTSILSRTNKVISVPMSSAPTPIFSLPPNSSRIEISPAKWVTRFMPTDDAYVNEFSPATNYGSDDFLSVMSYRPVGGSPQNRRIFVKFDVLSELPDINVDDVAEAWLVIYCENVSQFYASPWDDYPLTDPDADLFFLPDVPINVEVRQVEDQNWSEDNITWNNQPTAGEPITAMEFPYDNSHVIKDNEAWFTWEITSWVKDRMNSGENVSFLLRAPAESATMERYANFSSKERSGFPTANENETGGEMNKATGHPPYLKPHLTVIYENGDEPGPPVMDDWGAFIEGGSVKFSTDYYNYPEHDFTFESGALLQQQYGFAYEMMIADPGVIIGEHVDDDPNDAFVVTVNRYRIVNFDQMTTSSNVKLKVNITENTDFRIAPTDDNGDGTVDPNRENVLITIRSGFEWPWKRYLRDEAVKWNQTSGKGGLEWWANQYWDPDDNKWGVWSGNVVEFQAKQFIDRNIRFYVWGRVEDPTIKDIYYYDRTFDVEVTIGV